MPPNYVSETVKQPCSNLFEAGKHTSLDSFALDSFSNRVVIVIYEKTQNG